MRSLQRISSIFLTFGVLVGADEYNHRYTQGDSVHFYVNKVRL
jgi:hypothetical protein